MTKIIFNYGTMNSGKTTNLLTTKYQIEQYGINTSVYKPSMDTRDKDIVSRTGISTPVDHYIKELDDNMLSNFKYDLNHSNVIFIDECQFMLYNDIIRLGELCSEIHSESLVMAYGLLKDFNNNLFDGSRAWLEIADKYREIKSMCQFPSCRHKATCNYLNKETSSNDNVVIGGNDMYNCYCRYHYLEKMKGRGSNED